MTTQTAHEDFSRIEDRPGAQLAAVRTAKGHSVDYVAAKLHLRVRVIEYLEADDYQNLPDAVFIKGYLRAYAKLMEVNPAPFLDIFNQNFLVEHKTEKALWQSRRDTSRAERSIRWITTLFGVVVLVAVTIWWYKSQDNQNLFANAVSSVESNVDSVHAEADIRLMDLSKMRSLLSLDPSYSTLEEKKSD